MEGAYGNFLGLVNGSLDPIENSLSPTECTPGVIQLLSDNSNRIIRLSE